ncbi:MAG TPA: ABC transporter permease [Ktedonobacterales bacterium]|nr:ABC transporter permease [Ktedonobacterales bacterium]
MTPGISQESAFPAPSVTDGWLGHTWRLVRWNLRLARRRLMSKILLGILLAGLLLVLGVLLLVVNTVSSISSAEFSANCPSPVATSSTGDGSGTNAPCTPASTQNAQQQAQSAKNSDLQLLSFPTILAPVGGYTSFMGTILLCILAGTVIGSEYAYGTQRLALSRGVSRAQLLAGQVGTLAILALAVAGFMLLLGALIGLALGPALGASLPSLPASGLLQLVAFWLVLSLHLFAYALIALLLATLSSSTAVGIAGSLGYLIFESIALPIVVIIASALTGSTVSNVFERLPAFFLGPNLDGLLNGVNQSPLDLGGGSSNSAGSGSAIVQGGITPLQGLLVALLYCIVLVGASYWVLRKRDVTH